MEKNLAHCGLDCAACGAYRAYKAGDDEIRKKTSQEWLEQFDINIKPEDINCAGCKSEGKVLFNHCHICEIRKCSTGKGLENCAYCDDYACNKLEDIFAFSKEAKMNLDGIRVGH